VLGRHRADAPGRGLDFAREHESEFQSTFGPVLVSMKPGERWDEL